MLSITPHSSNIFLPTQNLLQFLSSLPEFLKYLAPAELLKFSCITREFRKELKPLIFSRVYFNNDTEFTFNKLLEGYYNLGGSVDLSNRELSYLYYNYERFYGKECNSIASQLNQFKSQESHKFCKFIRKLTIRQGLNQVINLSAISFYNLQSVEFINTKMNYFEFTDLFSKLTKLTKLTLNHSNIFLNSKSITEIQDAELTLPATLKYLHLESTYFVKGLISSPQIAGHRFLNTITDLKHSDFSTANLTELVSLTCKNMINSSELINTAILTNPGLKRLSVYMRINSRENLSYLKNAKGLKELEIHFTGDINLNYFNAQDLTKLEDLNSLKLTNFDVNSNGLLLINLILSAPNLKSLELDYTSELLPNLNKILEKLNSITNLKLINRSLVGSSELNGISSDSVKIIEFEGFQADQVNLSELENRNKNLRRVTIKKSSRDHSLIDADNNKQKFTNWSCYFGVDNVQCYKI
ncbi:hypothetical protein CONCODRAFT_6721 [Conidiobolus coronatus NRRL 28638]|uniref:F-box domain-containing protein n=1 Tax=Conidiobolus coronatus (strain ATCC 28846 / CBS 209.66 / NRRL 28638) TaxID=796925 RepID=A0A137P6T4_CONC2|nr:hypothetical protein CONCODRAFT_6721 [Conidiobolus coronatus NRRL 28638]|eukprot:KXN70644.1 hypothetical protein CONCODRAFT_6721 [Conidiobolus coronatus NRRL 28638]